MNTKFNPSITQSWLFWRKQFTQAGERPFSRLVEANGLDYPLTAKEYDTITKGHCPFCHSSSGSGQPIVVHEDETYMCICEVLKYQEDIATDNAEVRTRVAPADIEMFLIPKGYTAESIVQLQTAQRMTKGFIKDPQKWLMYLGQYGTGKTLLARAINKNFMPMSLYISAKDLEDQTHRYRKTDSLDTLYNILSTAPVLILDDLGAEYGGDLVKSVVDRIIDRRYERWPELPTVVITNLTSEALRAYIPRAADRLFDKAKVAHILLDKPSSYRQLRVKDR